MIENEITQRIIKCAMKVHTALGPGLLESAYEECLFYELKKEGLHRGIENSKHRGTRRLAQRYTKEL